MALGGTSRRFGAREWPPGRARSCARRLSSPHGRRREQCARVLLIESVYLRDFHSSSRLAKSLKRESSSTAYPRSVAPLARMPLLVRSAPARHALRRRALVCTFMAIVAAALKQDDEAALLLMTAAAHVKLLLRPSRRFVLRPVLLGARAARAARARARHASTIPRRVRITQLAEGHRACRRVEL